MTSSPDIRRSAPPEVFETSPPDPWDEMGVRDLECTPGERLPFLAGAVKAGSQGVLYKRTEAACIDQDLTSWIRVQPPAAPIPPAWPPVRPVEPEEKQAFRKIEKREKLQKVYQHMATEGPLSLLHLTSIQNLHNFMVKICHNERANQFEVAAYLHEVLKDFKQDLVFVPHLPWEMTLEEGGDIIPKSPIRAPKVEYKERSSDKVSDNMFCRRFIANVVYVNRHFLAFVLDRRRSFLYILDTIADGREERVGGVVNSVALWLYDEGLPADFDFGAVPCTRQTDADNCGVICAHWIRQTLRDFVGLRIEASGIKSVALTFHDYTYPPPQRTTEILIRDWAIRPGYFQDSLLWAKTDTVTNICIALWIPNLPAFFRGASRFNIQIPCLERIANLVERKVCTGNRPQGFLTFIGGFRLTMPVACHNPNRPHFGTYYAGLNRMFHAGTNFKTKTWTRYKARTLPERLTPALTPQQQSRRA
ncbi:unnamed protein product [Clonostachys rosea f. rosea IK726]|uniref:Uncharacterized protein n=1 Tax=Clonostachys rosea f. rosea IK726 TaxID=1349383 RepID=A0ACA9USC3_BIOOC|nr:unnamed protein product [Clonostachys rosea f. rosea IK726]